MRNQDSRKMDTKWGSGNIGFGEKGFDFKRIEKMEMWKCEGVLIKIKKV